MALLRRCLEELRAMRDESDSKQTSQERASWQVPLPLATSVELADLRMKKLHSELGRPSLEADALLR